MKDLNFFEPYIEKREFKFDKIFLLCLLLAISVVTMAFLGIYNQITISKLSNQVAERSAIANNPETVAKVEEIKALEAEMTIFRDEVNKVVSLDKNIEENDKIDNDLLSEIRSKMPADTFLKSLSVFDKDINISGVSKDSYSIAEFAKGLDLMDDTESIFISNITSNEEFYDFQLNLRLKDVSVDGIQPRED